MVQSGGPLNNVISRLVALMANQSSERLAFEAQSASCRASATRVARGYVRSGALGTKQIRYGPLWSGGRQLWLSNPLTTAQGSQNPLI